MQAQLLAIFVVETTEHVQAMNRHLLALEEGATGEAREVLLPELFREAHNLKGAARAVSGPGTGPRYRAQGPVMARVRRGSWMLTNRMRPSGAKVGPVNSEYSGSSAVPMLSWLRATA